MLKREKMKILLAALLTLALVATMVPIAGFAAGGTVKSAPVAATAGDAVQASAVTGLKLDRPEQQYKPEVRWWLSQGAHTEETIKESVKEIADSGFAGIEFAMLNETNVNPAIFAYGSQEWANDVKLIIQECTKYGMSASFTSGTHWATANIPGLDPNSEGANHELAVARAVVAQGDSLVTVPKPAAAGQVNVQTFESAVAYRLAGENPNTTNPTIREPLLINPNSAIDLTEDAKDGTINFTATDGDYIIFTFWYRGTGHSSSPAVQTSYAVNYFDRAGFEALKTYWESYLFADPELVEIIRKNGNVQMFMDSLEISNSQGGSFGNNSLFWTKDMREEFRKIKGYDITPYLPVFLGMPSLFGVENPRNGTVDFAGDEGKTFREKVLDDLRDVQTQLYMKNLMVPLRQWLNDKYHIKLRAQISYGKYLEISQPITVVDFPETETRNQRDQTDIYRVWAGGAHLQNKVLSSETSAHDKMNYGYSLQEYLQQNYMQYAGGVNRVIWHGYASIWGPSASVRWPGYEAGMNAINGRWGTRNPSYKDYNEYNDHLGRVQTVLRAGVPQVDLAILYSDYAYQLPKRSFVPASELQDLKQQKHEGWQWADLTLQDQGYTYDYFAPQYLDGGFAKYDKSRKLLAAEGPSYQALLVYQPQMPLASAKSLLSMAKDGLKVILVQGAMTKTSWYDGKDAELKSIRQQLLSLNNVTEVADQKSAASALANMNVTPRAGYSRADEELLSVTRKDNDATYLFLYNFYNVIRGWDQDFTAFSKNGSWDPAIDENSLEIEGVKKPYLLDLWTGEITEIAEYSYQDGKTIVPFKIPDGDARVFIFKDATDGGLRVSETNAAGVFLKDGTFTARRTGSGEAWVQMSDGKRYTASGDVPPAKTLTGWDVKVESWMQGEKSAARSETTSLGNYTEEYSILTKKTDISFPLDTLSTWNNLEPVGVTVSGIGTYQTTFDWDGAKASGAYLDLGRIVESAVVYVNGKKTKDLNLMDAVVDIPGNMLIQGKNTLEIVITTPLANTVLALKWNGGNLSEGPYYDGSSRNNLYDHVYTYFDHGLPQAILRPYVDTVVYEPVVTPPDPPAPPKPPTPPVSVTGNVSISNPGNQVWTGKQIRPAVKVTYGGKTLSLNTDYTVSWGANKNIGQGTITVTGKGDFKDVKRVSFRILPKSTFIRNVLPTGKNQVRVNWMKTAAAQKITSWQLRYRQKNTTAWRYRTLAAGKNSYTVAKLKKGKAYTFQIRAFKTVGTVKYFSGWSSVKTSGAVK